MLTALAAVLGLLSAPGGNAAPWSQPPISSPMFESHPAFDPWTGDLLFVRSDRTFAGWRILQSRCGPKGWSEPADAPFAGPGVEADPWFTPDGRTLYFISTRATGSGKSGDLDIWSVSRTSGRGWAKPERLPEPVNSTAAEWYPRLGPDGWLYFGSSRPGGLGKTDIWRAQQVRGHWRVENLGPGVNTDGDEYEPLPTPDGRGLIVQAGSDYFVSDRRGKRWGSRRKLGPALNGNGSEIGALISPDGSALMFARDVGEPKSGELMMVGRSPGWPPACPRR